jgi:hypothetical protein
MMEAGITRRLLTATLCCCVALVCSLCVKSDGAYAQDELRVTASFDAQTSLTRDTPIELRLSRALKTGEGRIAVVIGHTDVTGFFISDGTRLVYSPSLVPLPVGVSQAVIYRVQLDGTWHELARFPLQVVETKPTPSPDTTQTPISMAMPAVNVDATRAGAAPQTEGPTNSPVSNPTNTTAPLDSQKAAAESTPRKRRIWGFEKMDFVPSLAINVKSQLLQLNFPAESRPAQRATFNDVTMQFSLRSESVRGLFASQTQFDFAGSSFQQEALRFGTLGDRAPQIDLASYLMQFQLGRVKLMIGHTSFGAARHLVNGFSSRGMTLTVPITKRVDFSVAAMNGTNVVGYGNFFGLNKRRHQLLSGTIGIELFPDRPGGLRLEFSALTAYIQALNNFSQGSINDVERSKGGSVRLLFTDKSQRFRFEGGFTRSQFRNPPDPLLYQGTNTIPVPNLTRNARYIDVSFDVLRGFAVTKNTQANLNIAYRYEQVDPLFRSLGASAQPDKKQNEFQLSGNIGEISFQAGQLYFNDNLRRIPSILQSLSRDVRFSVALPAAALVGGTSDTTQFLPRISYSYGRTHQFGAAIPTNGGFETDPSLIPDQFNTNQTVSAEWQFKKFNVGYSYNRSFTDNEQPGREQSDFINQTNSARAGFNPLPTLNLTFDLNRDSATDLEGVKLLRTWRIGTTLNWNLNKNFTVAANVSNTIAGDRAQTSGSRNTEFDTQLVYRFGFGREGLKKLQTQIFVRYADRYGRSNDILFDITNLNRVKLLNAGLTITLF